jgi:DNA-binding MarR family transcriptional regulator
MAEQTVARQARELMVKMMQIFEAALAPGKDHPFADLALTPREVNLLILLGDRGELIMTELAAAIDVPLSTATRLADRLYKKELIHRERSDRDRRVVVVQASEKGRLLHETFKRQHLDASFKMLAILTEEERETFLALTGKLAEGLHR